MLHWSVYSGVSLSSAILMAMMVLVGVAFLTLVERKVLGFIQCRKGPNKVGVKGWAQPFGDAFKLFSKESLMVFKSNYVIYYLCPLFMIFMMLLSWLLIVPWVTNLYCMNYSLMLMVVILSLLGYTLLMLGWSSNSMFSLISSVRFVAQSISYEVSFMLVLFILMILSESYSLKDMMIWQMWMWNGVLLIPVFLIFFISCLAEMNRAPMDLIEGESELVSGFNVEYFSVGFALIFMGEYGMVMFFSALMPLMFTNLMVYSTGFTLLFMFFVGLVVCMRGMLPRMRYDELMYLCWKIILPVVLSYLFYILGVKIFLMLIF